ncbi:hypothetical protein [Bradyrhizobium sp. 2TAF24]|uniref:hypothetical protein n=1 Tax=Bradyrhizobium sp. 2TAF24 TaxID=3233011 RepID=UPI003F930745
MTTSYQNHNMGDAHMAALILIRRTYHGPGVRPNIRDAAKAVIRAAQSPRTQAFRTMDMAFPHVPRNGEKCSKNHDNQMKCDGVA